MKSSDQWDEKIDEILNRNCDLTSRGWVKNLGKITSFAVVKSSLCYCGPFIQDFGQLVFNQFQFFTLCPFLRSEWQGHFSPPLLRFSELRDKESSKGLYHYTWSNTFPRAKTSQNVGSVKLSCLCLFCIFPPSDISSINRDVVIMDSQLSDSLCLLKIYRCQKLDTFGFAFQMRFSILLLLIKRSPK